MISLFRILAFVFGCLTIFISSSAPQHFCRLSMIMDFIATSTRACETSPVMECRDGGELTIAALPLACLYLNSRNLHAHQHDRRGRRKAGTRGIGFPAESL